MTESSKKLQTWVQEKVRNNRNLRYELASLTYHTEQTIQKYIEQNHPILCEDYCLELIGRFLAIETNELTQQR